MGNVWTNGKKKIWRVFVGRKSDLFFNPSTWSPASRFWKTFSYPWRSIEMVFPMPLRPGNSWSGSISGPVLISFLGNYPVGKNSGLPLPER